MFYEGLCSCGQWQVRVSVTKPLANLNPRLCDCNYCQNHPSAIVSDPDMTIDFVGGTVKVYQNGDQLANFYRCNCCDDLLAVGCNLKGALRGAVNAGLLGNIDQFGKSVQIQPRLLSPVKS